VTKLPAWAEFVLIPLLNLALAFGIAGIVVALLGESPVAAMKVMIQGAFLYDGALGYTLYYMTSLIFTGLAVAVAFQARLFNIGGEGQAYIGGLGALVIALSVGHWLPGILSIPLSILGAAAFGALWAFLPGWLQAYRGSHVVITTIMFNFIASGIMVALLAGPLIRPGQPNPESALIPDSARLPTISEIAQMLGFQVTDSPLNLAFPLALIACVGVWALIWRTRWGYALRAMGESEDAAKYAGIKIQPMIVSAMALSGALAGLMAINVILGAQGKVTLNFPAGFGITGIAVALMGRSHPFGIVLAALLFAALFQGGTELDFEFQTITREMVVLIQGLIILFSGALALMFVPVLSRILGRP
jgi:simple sugar transport system permease protein